MYVSKIAYITSVSTDRTLSKGIERAGKMYMDMEHRKLKVIIYTRPTHQTRFLNEKRSCYCEVYDSRSYCMQQYRRTERRHDYANSQ